MFAGPILNKEYIRRKSDMCQGFQNIYQSNKTNKNNIINLVEYQQMDQSILTAGVQVAADIFIVVVKEVEVEMEVVVIQ